LSSLIKDLKVDLTKKVKLLMDNKSIINLDWHLASHGRSKHIETNFHYIREQVNNGSLEIEHCRSKMQLINVLTKAMELDRFKNLRKLINVTSVNESLA